MSKLNFTRPSTFYNKYRDYRLFVDGVQVGKIGNGDVASFPVAPGKHTLSAKVDWCGSKDFTIDIKEGETKSLTLRTFKYGNLLMPMLWGAIVLHIILSRFWGINYGIALVLPGFLMLIYYLTIGRKQYLRILDEGSW